MGNIDTPVAGALEQTPVTPHSSGLRQLIDAIATGAESRDRGERNAADAIALVRASKLGLIRLPVSEGGSGASLTQLFEVVIDLAEADSNIPHILRNHFAFVERARRAKGSSEKSAGTHFRHWLDLVRDGSLVGSGTSELGNQRIGAGTGATRLLRRGDNYVLNGKKYYSTGNFYDDFILVNAQTEEEEHVSVFVGRHQAGVNIIDDWDGIGQRLTASGTSEFNDVEVATGDVFFGKDDDGKPLYSATFPQLYLTAIIAGILRAVVKDAVALVKRRERNYYHAVAARPGDDPLLQQIIGQIASAAYVAESAVLRAADALGAAFQSAIDGKPDDALFLEAALRAAKTKVTVDELAQRAAAQLFDVGGASAVKQSQRLDRHWRNIRTLASHNPTSYKARVIGDHLINNVTLPQAAFF